MKLFLMRHAKAKDTFPDYSRQLSGYGIDSVKRLCKSVNADMLKNVGEVWHSSYERAAETAKIFVKASGIKAKLVEVDGAYPDSDPQAMLERILSFRDSGKDIMLVTHNPFVESLSAMLAGGGVYTVFRTCTLAGYTLVADPTDLAPCGLWSLDFFVSARDLA